MPQNNAATHAAKAGSISQRVGRTRGKGSRSNETSAVLRPIIDTLCRGATRLWRNNVGGLFDRTGRFVAYGLGSHAGEVFSGSSDALGLHSITITPEMVGFRIAVFVAIEAKDQGQLTPAQRTFLTVVHEAGGIAGVAHSVDEARQILDRGPWQPPLGL
jgi:hypothetical protein